MQKKIFAANWKMSVNSKDYAVELIELYRNLENERYDAVLLPSFLYLGLCEGLSYGAQDCSSYEEGAYTGDISASQIVDIGGKYVLIGHSERRKYYRENEGVLLKKIKMAQKAGLKVIFCVGESEDDYEKGKTLKVLDNQLEAVPADVIVAYEPIWAIGTGKVPENSEIEKAIQHIKQTHKTVLYGGSVSSANIKNIEENTSVDGFLVGGASTKISEIEKIFS